MFVKLIIKPYIENLTNPIDVQGVVPDQTLVRVHILGMLTLFRQQSDGCLSD